MYDVKLFNLYIEITEHQKYYFSSNEHLQDSDYKMIFLLVSQFFENYISEVAALLWYINRLI